MENTNDTQRESWIDRRVQRALSTDHRYIYAENAEEQSEAEAAIEREAEAAYDRRSGATSVALRASLDTPTQWGNG